MVKSAMAPDGPQSENAAILAGLDGAQNRVCAALIKMTAAEWLPKEAVQHLTVDAPTMEAVIVSIECVIESLKLDLEAAEEALCGALNKLRAAE